MLNGYLDLYFDVLHAAKNNKCAHNNDERLVNPGPFSKFINFKLSTSSGNHVEDFSHADIVSLKYKTKTSAKDFDDLSIGFDRVRRR